MRDTRIATPADIPLLIMARDTGEALAEPPWAIPFSGWKPQVSASF
ncbi:hypothetical protein AB0B25_04250 [Nocardia sp. NPDC049190]